MDAPVASTAVASASAGGAVPTPSFRTTSNAVRVAPHCANSETANVVTGQVVASTTIWKGTGGATDLLRRCTDGIHMRPRSASFATTIRKVLKYLGPAFVVSVAYMDPGNFGTNITAGSQFGYSLLWVLLWSNMFAILFQTLSAKLGIATGLTLPEQCARLFKPGVNRLLWCVGVASAVATNLAEVLGGALGFYLLFGMPLPLGTVITCCTSSAILALGDRGQRLSEMVIAGLVSVIGVCYVLELFLVKPDWSAIGRGILVPSLTGQSLYVVAGMLGATVMPHVIYLHSHLVLVRRKADREAMKEHLFLEKVDVFVAMNTAFVINSAMVVMSSATFYVLGVAVETIEEAHKTLAPLLGNLSSSAFALALLCSGLSSTAVGMHAGQIVANGFVGLRIRPWMARLATVVPAVAIIMIGWDPVKVLVLSQVCLSLALPGAIIPLLLITGKRDVMGQFVNDTPTAVTGWVVAGLIVILNAALIVETLLG
ncbi:MAG: Nramp family divalent metal transporter [Firmicutes bacterium]|nr:Nramp family divalent metal transporter [Candidatus Fermentithermobacillaceae bacterium]